MNDLTLLYLRDPCVTSLRTYATDEKGEAEMFTRIFFIGSLLVFGCDNDKGTTPNPEAGFVVSGTLKNDGQIQLPENLRVLVLWNVGADPDYNYFFGEGTVNAEDMTFEIVFDKDPPSEALTANALGVGYIILTTDSDLEEGIVPQDYDYSQNTLGAAGQYGVVFTNDKIADIEELEWPQQFPKGYGVGKGVAIPDANFDAFEPVDPSSVEIIVDDPENIEFVNWT